MKQNEANDNCRQFVLKIELRLEWIELLRSEILAFQRLQSVGDENGNYVPVMFDEEIQRRRAFLDEVLSDF